MGVGVKSFPDHSGIGVLRSTSMRFDYAPSGRQKTAFRRELMSRGNSLPACFVLHASKADGRETVHGGPGERQGIVLGDPTRTTRHPPPAFGRTIPTASAEHYRQVPAVIHQTCR